MNKKIPLIAFLILISSYGFGQISNVQDVRGVPLRTGTYEKIEGTPYFNGSDWMVGAMKDMDGKVYNNAQLRFNSFDNELEYLRNGGAIIVRKDQIKSFEVQIPNQFGSTESYYFSTGFVVKDEINPTDYVRVIYQGDKFSIVQKVFKKKSTVTPASYGEKDYEKFTDDESYYFIGLDKAEKIRLNKKSFYDIFPQYRDEIKDFIKKYNINFSDVEEVEALSQYVDKSLES